MNAELSKLKCRRDTAAERLGRARQAHDRQPDNMQLEQNLDEAEAAYLRADNAVLAAENKSLKTGRGNNV